MMVDVRIQGYELCRIPVYILVWIGYFIVWIFLLSAYTKVLLNIVLIGHIILFNLYVAAIMGALCVIITHFMIFGLEDK